MSVPTAEFVYDPYSIEAMTDPMPIYAYLREHHPVYYSAKYDTFFLSRFEDAWDFLSIPDNVFVTNEGTVFSQDVLLEHHDTPPVDAPTTPLGTHLQYGSPVYDIVRQAHGRGLRPGSVRHLEPIIRSLVQQRLDEVLPRGRFDLVHEFAGIISASVICYLFHIPTDQARELLDTVNAVTRPDLETAGLGNAPDMQARMIGLVLDRVSARRAEGHDGSWPLVDGMLDFRLDGRELTDLEIAMNLTCVLVGGTETLPKVVAQGLMELSLRPDQLAAVREDLPANCPTAFEEMLRFCGPAQWFGRTARVETTIAGQVIKPGQRVIYLTQSAGRDSREFDNPDEFRWNRNIPRTLAFGRGQHFCIGVHVARLEGAIALEEFLKRVPSYSVDLDGAVRLPSFFQLGYAELPVVVG